MIAHLLYAEVPQIEHYVRIGKSKVLAQNISPCNEQDLHRQSVYQEVHKANFPYPQKFQSLSYQQSFVKSQHRIPG